MPTLENQKEELLAMEAQRADNRGPKGPEIEVQLGGVGSTVSSPTGVWGEAPADFDYGAV